MGIPPFYKNEVGKMILDRKLSLNILYPVIHKTSNELRRQGSQNTTLSFMGPHHNTPPSFVSSTIFIQTLSEFNFSHDIRRVSEITRTQVQFKKSFFDRIFMTSFLVSSIFFFFVPSLVELTTSVYFTFRLYFTFGIGPTHRSLFLLPLPVKMT